MRAHALTAGSQFTHLIPSRTPLLGRTPLPSFRQVINISVVALAVAIFAICTVTTIIDIINEA